MRHVMRCGVISAVVAAGVACAGGGGKNHYNPCAEGLSPAFASQISNWDPPDTLFANCPLTLGKLGTQTFSGYLRFDFNTNANLDSAVRDQVYRLYALNTIVSSTDSTPVAQRLLASAALVGEMEWNPYPSNQTWHFSNFISFTIGWPHLAGTTEVDSLWVYYRSYKTFSTSTGYCATCGERWAKAAVVRDPSLPDIIGSTTPQPGGPVSYRAYPTADTTGYWFKWFLDGTHQTSDTNATFTRTFTAAGSYTVRVDQYLLDTVYSVTANLTVPVALALSGPNEVQPYTTNSYSASASYGTSPYSYSWEVDGSSAGTGSSLNTTTWLPESQHEVRANVTDANGKTGTNSMWVVVNTGCDPQDPNCGEMGAPASASPSGPRTIPGRRTPPRATTWWRRILGVP